MTLNSQKTLSQGVCIWPSGFLHERQVWQRQQTPAHGSQAPSRPGRRRRQKRAAAKGPIDRPASTVEDTAQQASRQPSAYRPGVLSDRPEFLDQLSSATGCTWSPPPPGQGGVAGLCRGHEAGAWPRPCTHALGRDPRRHECQNFIATTAWPCGTVSGRVHSP